MIDKRGKLVCPKCQYSLLAREGMNKVFCLSSSCDWSIEIKRSDDGEIPEIHTLKYMWE